MYDLDWTIKLYYASIINRSPILLGLQLPLHIITQLAKPLAQCMGFCHITPTDNIFALCSEAIGFIDFGNGNVSLGHPAHYFERLLLIIWSLFPSGLPSQIFNSSTITTFSLISEEHFIMPHGFL